MPEIDTEKGKDPSFNRVRGYQDCEGQKMQVTYISDGVHCTRLWEITELSREAEG